MIKDRKIEFPTLPTGNKIMVGNLFIVFLSNWSFLCSNDRFDSEKDQIDSLAVDLLKDRQDRFAHGQFFKRTTGLIRLWSKYRRQRFDLKDRRSRDQKIEFLTLPPCPPALRGTAAVDKTFRVLLGNKAVVSWDRLSRRWGRPSSEPGSVVALLSEVRRSGGSSVTGNKSPGQWHENVGSKKYPKNVYKNAQKNLEIYSVFYWLNKTLHTTSLFKTEVHYFTIFYMSQHLMIFFHLK